MSKLNFLTIIIITALLSACGFHTPNKNTTINAAIVANVHNEFANTLQAHLNANVAQSLSVQIGNEVFKQQNASYKSNNEVNGYNLSLSVFIQVFGRHRKPLLVDTISAKVYVDRIISVQADRIQIEENKTQLRNTLVKKLLRKLNRL